MQNICSKNRSGFAYGKLFFLPSELENWNLVSIAEPRLIFSYKKLVGGICYKIFAGHSKDIFHQFQIEIDPLTCFPPFSELSRDRHKINCESFKNNVKFYKNDIIRSLKAAAPKINNSHFAVSSKHYLTFTYESTCYVIIIMSGSTEDFYVDNH